MDSIKTKPILVVDDSPHMRMALKEALQKLGHRVVLCENGVSAIEKLHQHEFSLILTDMKMPKMDGLTFLREVRQSIGNLPVLVITGFGTIENAVETMKEGATDYIMKPFSFEILKKAIENILIKAKQNKEILTNNPKMQNIIHIINNLALSDITILIQGESGTGKELLARQIHRLSKRSGRPFVAVNCAAIPDNLLESELFGHEKGAFTGAIERKIGKFELAKGGTILLDEIGEMSMMLQAKLLRVLQEREIDRIGGKDSIPVDVRVIATTNKDLYKECMEGRFREDLYYRLNVFPVNIPPLRERPDDIPLLAIHFMKKFSVSLNKEVQGFSEDAMCLLKNRQWRGNVRELENVLQRAVFLCKGSYIEVDDLLIEDEVMGSVKSGNLKEAEKRLILQTLKDVNGNKTKAARVLGISVRTIRNKLNEYGKNFPEV
ncbi:MAG: sigma-54-dependent Fis family transcriptional regulator [Nitrospirae bacterium]|nr:sigma-54-dependent Fis family transcriptional regulator [Nitrospirota bacterium]